ncbi:2-hydroxyacid dehydrogenase [Candidatus Enterococcus clewellii]|uniref:D-isomer specific 2-hydroxyacid dehydrogenase n=1 Tax=Candidatus Enterococcus clewellii TaxID=1834193 RepID=A0A242K607_9ENTE|nr:2-hydroxyacid dehydrogenase [Enterococcus sp. 9E7_DIV0242]OTP15752.1 D-isomer specific 2-hydroxyacid dehydrogenase [Enterococcus sp. 9E7_DIV0242]
MFKIACYGVRPNEVAFFNQLNIYNYELTLIEGLLTHDNIDTAQGHDAVLLRGNCVADSQNIDKFKEYGIKYVFTRTVGFNHIDLEAAAKYEMRVTRVPSYSPNAIAELSLTLAMMLLRHTAYTTMRTSYKNFIVNEEMFSKEVRNCTVGIIGTGKIGLTEASLFKGLGAHVIGYDIYQPDAAKEVLTFKALDELLAESDIVSLHVPFIPGENDQMINAEFLAKMKPGAILINTARGELQDNEAILNALESNHLAGFGTDVFANEKDLFFKAFQPWQALPDGTVQRLIDLYPRVLVTPHIGSNTDEALSNMITTSFENFNDILTTGTSVNELELPKVSQAV